MNIVVIINVMTNLKDVIHAINLYVKHVKINMNLIQTMFVI